MKKNVLFLCTQNSCHSQMAEGILRYFSKDEYNVFSAGINPTEVDKTAVDVMKEIGIDISNQKAKSFKEFADKDFDVIITFYDHKEEDSPSFWEKAQILHWDFVDPSEGISSQKDLLKAFREVRDEIHDKIKEHF